MAESSNFLRPFAPQQSTTPAQMLDPLMLPNRMSVDATLVEVEINVLFLRDLFIVKNVYRRRIQSV